MSESRNFMGLDWVRDELNATLNQAREALEAHVESRAGASAGPDPTLARQCLTRLHEVNGTLQMVEVPGAADFAGELEALAQSLMDGNVPADGSAEEALMEGILRLSSHLDRVQRGGDDVTTAYIPLLNRMRLARSVEPLPLPVDEDALDAAALAGFLSAEGPGTVRQLRGNLQRAILALLRHTQPAARLWPYLDRVFTRLEAVLPVSPRGRLWGLAAGVMERWSQRGATDPVALVPVLRGLDSELRILLEDPEGSLAQTPPERLVELLVDELRAESPADSARNIALRQHWVARSAAAARDAAADGADAATLATVAAVLHEELAGIRDQLDLFVRGSADGASGMDGMADVLQRIASTLAVVDLPELRARITDQIERVRGFAAGIEAVDEEAVMSVASAVLEVDARLMGLAGLAGDEADLVPGSLSDAKAAVLREVRSSLAEVKASIVEFVSSEWQHAHLSPVVGTLSAVRSVLDIVPLERAGDLVECCRLYLQHDVLAENLIPEWQRLDTLADAITSIDYYLERILDDRAIQNPRLLDIAEESVATLGYPRSALPDGGHAALSEALDAPDGLESGLAASAVGDGNDDSGPVLSLVVTDTPASSDVATELDFGIGDLDAAQDDPEPRWRDDEASTLNEEPTLLGWSYDASSDAAGSDGVATGPAAEGGLTRLDWQLEVEDPVDTAPAAEHEHEHVDTVEVQAPSGALDWSFDPLALASSTSAPDDDDRDVAVSEDDFKAGVENLLDHSASGGDTETSLLDLTGAAPAESDFDLGGGSASLSPLTAETPLEANPEAHLEEGAPLDPAASAASSIDLDAESPAQSDRSWALGPELDAWEREAALSAAPVETDFDLGGREDPFETLMPAENGDDVQDRGAAVADQADSVFELAVETIVPDDGFDLDELSVAALVNSDASKQGHESEPGEDDALIDDEVIEVFLEEVDEVLDVVDAGLEQWRQDPTDTAGVVALRRGFHTLKGSGRMVEAGLIAELAWSVENLLNRVLDGTIEGTDAVMELVAQSRAAVPGLRQAFADRAPPADAPEIERLMESADILASGGTPEDLQQSSFGLSDYDVEDTEASAEFELLQIFDSEAREHLSALRDYLGEASADGTLPPLGNNVRRALHTLKGSAAMASLDGMTALAGGLERVLRGYLEVQRPVDAALSALLRTGAELMEANRAHLSLTGVEPAAGADEKDFLARVQALQADLDAEAAARDADSGSAGTLTSVFDAEGMEQLVAASALLDAWGRGVGDAVSLDALTEAWRALAGRARDAGQDGVEALAARLADVLRSARDATRELPATSTVTALQDGHEHLMVQLDALVAGLVVPDAETQIAALSALVAASPDQSLADERAFDDRQGSALDESLANFELDPEMQEIFFEEAEELLIDLQHALRDWPAADARTEMQRALHTLKGGARMAGLDRLGDEVHDLEGWIDASDDRTPDEAEFLAGLQVRIDGLAERVAQLRQNDAPPVARAFDAMASPHPAEIATPEVDPGEPAFDAVPPAAQSLAPSPLTAALQAAANEGASDPDPEIVALFLEEAFELIESLDAALGRWRDEPGNELPLESLLRDLHTFKGGARMAGLSALGESAHELESRVTGLRGQAPQPPALADVQSVIDELMTRVSALDPSRAAPPGLADPAPLGSDAPLADPASSAPTPAPDTPVPAVEKPLAPRSAAEAPLKEAPQEMIRVAAGLLDNLVSLAGESSIMRGRIEQQATDSGLALTEMAATLERIRQQVRQLEMDTEDQLRFRQERSAQADDPDFDPLEMDRYTQLQELSRTLSEAASDVIDLRQTLVDRVRDTETLLVQQGRIHTELQEGLMRTRMVPFSRLLPRLQRIVRQVGRELSKPVTLELRDAEGELDRNVLERMIPPLEHMLRNALDHGIEAAEERARRGKPATGTITLRLAREGGEILIEVADDGGGIDPAAVRSKAIERGLLAAEAEPSEDDLLGFIMSPGFSTARAVTQISGRGVGMDVVASEVRQMGGVIDIASVLGEGTRFTVRLPFTVSINRALMVTIGEDEYALPLNTIEGIVRVSPQQLREHYARATEGSGTGPGGAPGFDYAGRTYALSYLGSAIGLPQQIPDDVQSVPVLMLRSGERNRAVHVDAVAGSREIVVKNLGPQFAGLSGVSGATILGDGRVVVILDLPSLLREGAATSLSVPVSAPKAKARDTRLRVLVVDDSVTVRKVTSRLLERQGMDVVLAKDGVEAISALQEQRPDVMLLDIEMPRMDGFEVARHVRNEERLSDLPIIMITSRTGNKHRQRASTLGVDRFFGKPFQEAELLAAIRELAAS